MDPLTMWAAGSVLSGLGGLGSGGSTSTTSGYVDPAQQPYLDFLRNSGMGLTGQVMPGAQQFGQQTGQQLYQQGQQSLQALQGNPFLSALQQQSGGNPALIQQQTQQLGADLGRVFNQQVLPGIRRDATAVGALGGSRQGVAEGIAGQGFADAFSRGVTDLQSADALRSVQAATSGAGIQAQGNIGALSMLPNLFGVGMNQFTGGFAPLSLFNSIVGQPTVLSDTVTESGGSGLLGLF